MEMLNERRTKLGIVKSELLKAAGSFAWISILVSLGLVATPAQEPDAAAVIRSVDAAVQARDDNVLGFTDIEHYVVYRGQDETHPAAEMTVKDTYRKGVGKTYDIQSKSGSSIILHFGLEPLLDNERVINEPAHLPASWFDSANYDMKPQMGATVQQNGRNCVVVPVTARRKASNTIDGTIWVDAKDGTLVQIQGVATASASAFTGTTTMMRQYVNVNGFAMATHARAETTSTLLGRTVVLIDYSNYQLQLKAGK
jgi:hypothetical protein